ncbi:MAG: hypothetical protein ABI760_03975 [Ferruginibacter sp.]
MDIENKERIEAVLNNLSRKYEHTGTSLLGKLTKEELINKVITAEATLEILTEVMKVLEWENATWNASAESRIKLY